MTLRPWAFGPPAAARNALRASHISLEALGCGPVGGFRFAENGGLYSAPPSEEVVPNSIPKKALSNCLLNASGCRNQRIRNRRTKARFSKNASCGYGPSRLPATGRNALWACHLSRRLILQPNEQSQLCELVQFELDLGIKHREGKTRAPSQTCA